MQVILSIVLAFIQLVQMILKNKFEKDNEKKQKRIDNHNEAMDALKNKSADKYHAFIERLRIQ